MKTWTRMKTAHVIYKCKKCKCAVRKTFDVETRCEDNEHPEYYLRKTRCYKRVAGGRWIDAHYFYFPMQDCPSCAGPLAGKAINGVFKADHPCDARCTGATGHNCECSCGGANHGMDHEAKPTLF